MAKAAKKKKDVSPEAAAQAEAMKHRLEELAAQRRERESSTKGRSAGGGWTPGGVEPHQIRSGRRGNR